ncbi:hypothetical protein Dimus_011430, partial [Dionaea muscipula]
TLGTIEDDIGVFEYGATRGGVILKDLGDSEGMRRCEQSSGESGGDVEEASGESGDVEEEDSRYDDQSIFLIILDNPPFTHPLPDPTRFPSDDQQTPTRPPSGYQSAPALPLTQTPPQTPRLPPRVNRGIPQIRYKPDPKYMVKYSMSDYASIACLS